MYKKYSLIKLKLFNFTEVRHMQIKPILGPKRENIVGRGLALFV